MRFNKWSCRLWAIVGVITLALAAMPRAAIAQAEGGAAATPGGPKGDQKAGGQTAAPAAPSLESGMTPPGQPSAAPTTAQPAAPAAQPAAPAPNLESGMTPPGQPGGAPAPAQPAAPGAPNLETGMPPLGQPSGAPAPAQPAAPAAPNLETGMPPPAPPSGAPTLGRPARRGPQRPIGAAPAAGAPAPTQRLANPARPGGAAAPVIRGPVPPTMGGGTVSDIRIVGTQRIENETVRSYLELQRGDPWDDEKVNASLKALFATGLFADVRLSRVGNTLVVTVVENPIINRIAFEGNHKLDDKELNAEIQLRPRVVYTRTRVQNDVKRILELYRRHGRFGATVEPKVIQLSENRVDLVFEINEGEYTGIRSINFVGNKEFSESKLRGVIATKESRWYRFLSTNDSYDPDRVTYDRDLLRKFYLTEGYADFRVLSAVAELTPQRNGFIITFTLDEGQRYRFGKVGVNIKLKDLPASAVEPLLTIHSGDWYNAEEVEKSITVLTNTLGNRGYAFVEVKPDITRNRKDRTIDITFDVQEGPRVYVERIDVVGNVRTLDKVIRREFQLVEGDAFNTEKMQRSQQRIKNLGFFKKVEVTNAPGSAPDKTVVTVEVEEQSTGELTLGLGFSTSDGPLADITIRERNFLGRGQDLRVGATVSFRSQQIDLSYTEPYFLDKNIAAGFDVFEIKTSPTESFFSGITPPYQQFSYGGSLRAGYQITENLRQTLTYTARSDTIEDIQSDASLFIALQAGQHVTSQVGQVLLYDRRDDRIDPTAGYYASIGNDFAGVGFGVDFVRTKVNFGYYYSVAPDWVLSFTGEAGDIFGWNGQNVLLQDRFFVGGDNLRGFQNAGIGPRDSVTDDALGGQKYYVGSVTLGVPLGLPKELGLSGRVFTDFGTLYQLEPTQLNLTPAQLATTGGVQPTVESSPAIRLSAGIGVSWKSPVGPIRLDLAVPIRRESFDQTQFFRVSFGTRF
ncbi:MAG TPA: outer membrane protein assembly factor BamA [Stellaceae bacterium]|nr:outer membrane protein assembly factor BamA [Stellaceae bacterium]